MRGVLGGLLAVALVATACADDDQGLPPAQGAEVPIDACDWPMWGYAPERTFASDCPTALSPTTVAGLERVWFQATDDVVTATPAVVGDTLYTGDWSGVVYALDRETGEERWRFQTAEHRNVYAGQIVSSPAVADVGGERIVLIGSGKTMYALDAADGTERWRHELGEAGDVDEPTEIESSPVVVDDVVLFGYDVHNTPGYRAGLRALDATDGELLWDFDPDRAGGQVGATGCVDIWSSPSVDVTRGLVFAGTGNCPSSPEGWGTYTEALFAVDLAGRPVWSHQPHEPNNDDLDFAGSPNLFRIGDRDVVGLGNKDGAYHVVDRETGEPVWRAEATEPGLEEEGSNFSTGGFIGATAVSDGVVVGGTGVGPCPCAHGIDAETGAILWQNEEPAATYASAAVANGVLFLGGNDFTLRAFDLTTGDILWSEEVQGAVAGGAVVSGDDLFAVAGIREPGLDERSETSGVYRFALDGGGDGSDTDPDPSPPTTGAAGEVVTALVARGLACTEDPCEVDFGINDPPPGARPRIVVRLSADPLRIEVTGRGLGDPQDWVRRGSAAARVGASRFGVFLSERDDDPFGGGGLVCSWAEGEGGCTGVAVPRYAPSYNRLSVLAIVDEATEPTLSDGADRLVRTLSFDPPLRAVEP